MPVADEPIPGKIPDTADPARDPEREARSLFWRGWNLKQIATELRVPPATVRSWKRRGKWGNEHSFQLIEERIVVKDAALIDKARKSGVSGKGVCLSEDIGWSRHIKK